METQQVIDQEVIITVIEASSNSAVKDHLKQVVVTFKEGKMIKMKIVLVVALTRKIVAALTSE